MMIARCICFLTMALLILTVAPSHPAHAQTAQQAILVENIGPGGGGCALSGDGQVIIGSGQSPNSYPGVEAWRWDETTGAHWLGDLSGGIYYSQARALSFDGSVIVGDSAGDYWRGFIWTAPQGMVAVGVSGRPTAISRDGNVLGLEGSLASTGGALRWSASSGVTLLGYLDKPGHNQAKPTAISTDGNLIVGTSSGPGIPYGRGIFEAFRWTPTSGMQGLGTLPGDEFSEALGASADGSIIVGLSWSASACTTKAFRWTQADGMVHILPFSGVCGSRAWAVSADGNTIVGETWEQGYSHPRAFIWSPERGMLDLAALLQLDYGLDMTGRMLQNAVGVSDDGRTILGQGYPGGTWLVRFLDAPVNVPPSASAGTDKIALVGEAVVFDGSGSLDADGSITALNWDFGDGSVGGGATASHVYTTAGAFTVTLTVTDDDGAQGVDTASVTVQGLTEALGSLSQLVSIANLAQGISTALDAKLQNALGALSAVNSGQRQDAKSKLDAFILSVEAQRGKELSDSVADSLQALARRILAVM